MQLTPRQALLQFGHVIQQQLFPHLEAAIGPLTPQLKLLTSIVSLIPLGQLLGSRRAATGRPAKDRAALATAFIAKAVFNLPTTRDLMGRLRVDQGLRQMCGWRSTRALPHESKFSRVFAEFSCSELPQQLHAAVIQQTQSERLIGHIARDATAIPARERVPEAVREQKKAERKSKAKSKGKKRGPKGTPVRAKERTGDAHRTATASDTGEDAGRLTTAV